MFNQPDSIPFNQYPDIARNYCRLSLDEHCKDHLSRWIEDRGQSLQSYYAWVLFRLTSDIQEVAEHQDYSEFNWDDFEPRDLHNAKTVAAISFFSSDKLSDPQRA